MASQPSEATPAKHSSVPRQLQFPFSPSTFASTRRTQGEFIGNGFALARRMPKRFVYVLKNNERLAQYYTGVTSDVTRRTVEHNAGNCAHTAKYRPWCVDLVIEFPDEGRAATLERYLKSGSGVAFAQRHLR
jgi:putative endonuclease